MFKKDDTVIHQEREAVVIEVNYLGIKLSYIDDDTLVFVSAARFVEILPSEPIAPKPIEVKLLPVSNTLTRAELAIRSKAHKKFHHQTYVMREKMQNITTEDRKRIGKLGSIAKAANRKRENDELAEYVAAKREGRTG